MITLKLAKIQKNEIALKLKKNQIIFKRRLKKQSITLG